MLRFDIRCLVVFGLTETYLFILNEAQQYDMMPHFIKKSLGQTPLNNKNGIQDNKFINARKNNNFDYSYDDWEDKQPDYYNFFINTTKTSETSHNASLTTITTPDTTVNISVPTAKTELTLDTKTIGTITDAPFETQTASSSTPHVPEFPDFTEDIFEPTTRTVPTTTQAKINPIVFEITRVQSDTRGGYFTSGLIVTLRKIASKKPADLRPLLIGLHAEVTRLNHNKKLVMFERMVLDTLTTMAHLASISPIESIQFQAKNGIIVLENRRQGLAPDTNAIMDIADTIFVEEDLHNTASFISDVEKYPNTTKAAIDIVSDGFKAFIFIPYERIEGTARDKLLMLEINNAVKNRLYENQAAEDRRRFGGGFEDDKVSTNGNMEKIAKFLFHTEKPTTSTVYMEYVRNATIMKRVKHRMKLYKEKFKIIKKKERGSSRRGPTTTTTTTTTTTPMPPMRKSKYYMRKYVKKDLYKMTTTTKKTTVFRWKYYGKIRKFNIDSDRSSDLTYTEDTNERSDEGYYTDYEINNEQTDRHTDSSQSIDINQEKDLKSDKEDKNAPITEYIDLNRNFDEEITSTNTNLIRHFNIDSKNSDKYLKIINKLTGNRETDVDKFDYLKANIRKAMYHKDNFKTFNDKRRFVTSHLKDKYEDISDYEIELKRNIYKAMNIP